MQGTHDIRYQLEIIYGKKEGEKAFQKILPLIDTPLKKRKTKEYFSHRDSVLITYGDSLKKDNELPLQTLHRFADSYLKDVFSTIHILPFYPYSSDDGFSVMDFLSVDPALGSWKDIKSLRGEFHLMFDHVLNHISAKSEWFQKYLSKEKGFEKLAIEVDPARDLSAVIRPRAFPLLTEFRKKSGERIHVWTTFSEDQIDLNYESIDVLEKMVEVMLFYVNQGARIIRLDAIAYLWKEIGTTCIHCKNTHDMVKLFRKILNVVAPDTILLTETNVPHDENISYFGDGRNEAQMVYNFTLPPLLLHAFVNEHAGILSHWAKGLHVPSDENTFYNFTASHDGIGVRPLERILDTGETKWLSELVKENGGGVSYKKNPNGTQSPYELNITYVDALLKKREDPYHVQRFLATQAVQYVLPGVPATYIHSLLGSRNWQEGVKHTKQLRTINREKLSIDDVKKELNDPNSFRSRIFYPYIELIKTRKEQNAFHPNSNFKILDINEKVFAIKRFCDDQTIYALTNVTSKCVRVSLKENVTHPQLKDLVTGIQVSTNDMELKPYQYMWLTSD
ncbi:MAG: sugar phosphorylase [Deltaproteobacteria bacterium]|nr:sugar phosphorylase [Deltaproteobacteria bacterium]